MTRGRRRGGAHLHAVTRILCLLLLLAVSAGCAGLPTSGPVRTQPATELVEDEPPVDFTPGGPRAGAAPVEIARGFLVAMQATPLNTSVARRFLTAESSTSWVPERGTVIYAAETRTAIGSDVRVDLEDTVELDGRGGWLGERGDARIRLRMVRERGEWRISDPPDRLVVPTTHFETRYNQYALYFFDKAAEVLVPEPVHVPTGAQAPTVLVQGLLRGPGRELLGVERTFLPAGTQLDDISVPLSADGTAQVPLSDEVLDLDDERLRQAFAQLAWTLRQVPGVERMRVTVDGSPLELPGEGPDIDVTAWSELSPAVAWANQSLFGIRDGRVVSVSDGEERRLSGPMGSLDLGLEEVAVDLAGERVAATVDGGTAVVVAARSRETGQVPRPSDVQTVVSGSQGQLSPGWDLYGQLWLVDRTDQGAAVAVVRDDVVEPVDVPKVSGQDVRAFVVSRDGTRFVALVEGRRRDRLLIARVQRDQEGRVRRVLPAESVPLGDVAVDTIRDLDFRTPTSLALLTAPTPETSQVVVVKVDGSSAAIDDGGDVDAFRGRAKRLVTSPAQGAALYLHTEERTMYALAVNGRWVGAGVEPGLRAPTYAG